MKYSISTCSFYKYRIRKLLDMPEDLGVEIFYEYGSRDMWNSFLDALPGRSFSIHAPFAFVDIAEDCDEEKLFDVLRRPFDMYHKYNGEFYVLQACTVRMSRTGRLPAAAQLKDFRASTRSALPRA